jgi:hypothetical protein
MKKFRVISADIIRATIEGHDYVLEKGAELMLTASNGYVQELVLAGVLEPIGFEMPATAKDRAEKVAKKKKSKAPSAPAPAPVSEPEPEPAFEPVFEPAPEGEGEEASTDSVTENPAENG